MQYEDDIMNRFNNKEPDAFSEVYKELFPAVYYFAKRFVGNEEAQDITADVFFKLWKMNNKFGSVLEVKIYLQISVRNTCINFTEHLKVVRHHQEIIIADVKVVEVNEHDDIKTEQLKKIFSEIEKLPKQRKKVFELFYFGRLKEKEIAVKMNIAARTVHNQKQFAMKQLREKLSTLF